MKESDLEGKRVFWANKWYNLWLLVIPIGVFIEVLTSDKCNPLFFWLIVIAVPLFTAYIFYHMFHPKFVWLDKTSIEGKKLWERKVELTFTDTGDFSYHEKGFDFSYKGIVTSILWEDIIYIIGYKKDLFTVDELNIELFLKNNIKLHITEETAGWYRFIDKLKEVYPSISKDFEASMMFPSFETSLTLIYDSENRSIEEVLNNLSEVK